LNSLSRYACLSLVVSGGLILALSTSQEAVAGGESQPEVVTEGQEDDRLAGLQDLFKKKDKKKKGKEPAAPAAAPDPNPELRAGLQCIDGIAPQDVQMGVMREYDVKEGMKVSQRSGFMDREAVTMTNTCFLGELEPAHCFAFTVDQAKYESFGNSNDWEVQCVYSDDPGAGAIENKDEYPYSVDRMPGKAMMLLCGHDEGDAYKCDSGNNSGRSGVWQKMLEAEGKEQLGFCSGEYVKQALTYDVSKFPGGRWVYCQYYNSQTKKNLFGYEFLQKVR
jgi:hypothetical protein